MIGSTTGGVASPVRTRHGSRALRTTGSSTPSSPTRRRCRAASRTRAARSTPDRHAPTGRGGDDTRRLDMTRLDSRRRFVAEGLGTGLLIVAIIGSGIMAERLSPTDVGLQLLEN